MTDPAAIAASLTKAQREALKAMDGEWSAGPSLPDYAIDCLVDLRMGGLVERYFADMHKPRVVTSDGCLSVRLGACWFFRLTNTGLAVRQHLHDAAHLQQNGEGVGNG
ncbi:MAG: hypothetical protein EOO77_03830 [Oxalobacteraceae bacterium]|nr:MAG: hypothetical protein EOO77_03830 [Oxalobacteraceae bacterium]